MTVFKNPAQSGQMEKPKSGMIEISISELRYLMRYAAAATGASDEVRKNMIAEVEEWAIGRLNGKTEGNPAIQEPYSAVRPLQDTPDRPSDNPESCQTESEVRRLSVWTLNHLHTRAKCARAVRRLEALILQAQQSAPEEIQSPEVRFVIEIR
jgi:hypothetical protein